jgi:hypothetical protein
VNFLALTWLEIAGALAAVAAPLTLLYLLRMQRRRVTVPFAPLWRRVLADRTPSRAARTLRRPLSLLLQLVLATLIVLALGDPHLGAPGRARSVALLIDCSASMQTREGAHTRLELARERARQLIARLDANDAALLVRMGAAPRALTGWLRDPRRLERALDSLDADDAAADVDGALALAQGALAGRQSATLIVISDGALPDLPRAPAALDLRFVRVGAETANVGITAMGARRLPGDRSRFELLVEAQNTSRAHAVRQLTIESEGEVIDAARLDLAPGERSRHTYVDLPGRAHKVTARLEPADALAADDAGYAVLPPRAPQRVLLVTPGNLFLEGALLLVEGVTITRVTPAAYDPARARAYDAVVFDRFAPAEPPAVPGSLYLAPPRERSPFAVRGTADRPILTEYAERHPALRHVGGGLHDVNIARSLVFALDRDDVALASAASQPVIVARERAGRRALAIGFELARSDLPMRVAFPVLLARVLDWFAGGDAEPQPGLRTGAAVAAASGQPPEPILRAGFAGGDAHPVAVNLSDPAESNIAPRDWQVAGHPVPPPTLGGNGMSPAPWTLLVAVALALALFEWVAYQRRWTV